VTHRPNKVTGANSRPASQFESRGLRRRALVVESHGRYHGGAAVAQFTSEVICQVGGRSILHEFSLGFCRSRPV
jgi:hypothetical protein